MKRKNFFFNIEEYEKIKEKLDMEMRKAGIKEKRFFLFEGTEFDISKLSPEALSILGKKKEEVENSDDTGQEEDFSFSGATSSMYYLADDWQYIKKRLLELSKLQGNELMDRLNEWKEEIKNKAQREENSVKGKIREYKEDYIDGVRYITEKFNNIMNVVLNSDANEEILKKSISFLKEMKIENNDIHLGVFVFNRNKSRMFFVPYEEASKFKIVGDRLERDEGTVLQEAGLPSLGSGFNGVTLVTDMIVKSINKIKESVLDALKNASGNVRSEIGEMVKDLSLTYLFTFLPDIQNKEELLSLMKASTKERVELFPRIYWTGKIASLEKFVIDEKTLFFKIGEKEIPFYAVSNKYPDLEEVKNELFNFYQQEYYYKVCKILGETFLSLEYDVDISSEGEERYFSRHRNSVFDNILSRIASLRNSIGPCIYVGPKGNRVGVVVTSVKSFFNSVSFMSKSGEKRQHKFSDFYVRDGALAINIGIISKLPSDSALKKFIEEEKQLETKMITNIGNKASKHLLTLFSGKMAFDDQMDVSKTKKMILKNISDLQKMKSEGDFVWHFMIMTAGIYASTKTHDIKGNVEDSLIQIYKDNILELTKNIKDANVKRDAFVGFTSAFGVSKKYLSFVKKNYKEVLKYVFSIVNKNGFAGSREFSGFMDIVSSLIVILDEATKNKNIIIESLITKGFLESEINDSLTILRDIQSEVNGYNNFVSKTPQLEEKLGWSIKNIFYQKYRVNPKKGSPAPTTKADLKYKTIPFLLYFLFLVKFNKIATLSQDVDVFYSGLSKLMPVLLDATSGVGQQGEGRSDKMATVREVEFILESPENIINKMKNSPGAFSGVW